MTIFRLLDSDVAHRAKKTRRTSTAGVKLVYAAPLTMKGFTAYTGGINFGEVLVLRHLRADLLT